MTPNKAIQNKNSSALGALGSRHLALKACCFLLLAGCVGEPTITDETTSEMRTTSELAHSSDSKIHPEIWPKQSSPIPFDDDIENRIAELLARMTLEEKVGQIIQADIGSVTPEEVGKYNLGSILNGGNSAPGNDNRTSPEAWLDLADEFWAASTDTSDGGLGIPAIWGTDAVHGHNNIVGATVFPHNIGLGAANDPELMFKIGEITALEMRVTGFDWTFAPTLAVVRNDRWGRTYESYSEDPAIVASFAGELVKGLQGVPGSPSFLDEKHLIATAKHFIGDGGTVDGKDQGDNISTEEELRDIQGAGYPPAIENGIQVVMASFNSWHGQKMHGHKELLNDVLVDQMGFDGFVVGDWNGHGQVAGCTNTSCAAAFNNGLDMFMAPDSWKALYQNTLEQVQSGEISMARLDEAVARILRVKMRAGLFTNLPPSQRPYAGDFGLLAAEEHKAVAREAVRKSLVLLKNEEQLLPLSPSLNVLVAGDGADDIGKQSGGWTLSWQGLGNSNEDFPQGKSIFAGIAEHVEASGGTATLSLDGHYDSKPDVAIVAFGEDPYAEFQGDRAHVDYASDDGLELLQKFQAEGIPTVALFISGRALWVNPELNASDAFVAVWLPGSEGGNGIADMLFRDANNLPRYDFEGRLSFSWPKTAIDTEVNLGDQDYDPLFPFGFGLSIEENGDLASLSEDSMLSESDLQSTGSFLKTGDPVPPWRLVIRDSGGTVQVTNARAVSATGALEVSAQDHQAQEDTSVFVWNDSATMSVEGSALDLSRESNGDMALQIEYSVAGEAVGNTSFSIVCGVDCAGSLNMTDQLSAKLGMGWQTARIKLSCFADQGADMTAVTRPFQVNADGPLNMQMGSIELVSNQGDASCVL